MRLFQFCNLLTDLVQFMNQMEREIFHLHSYKKLMQKMLLDQATRGEVTKAANFLGVQPSYLSRVMSQELQITPDHAFKLSRYWNLNGDEHTYFMLLVDHARAGDREYRADIEAKLNRLREKHQLVQERASRSHLSTEMVDVTYFSTWLWSAIHFLTSIPEYQTADAISSRLNIKTDLALFYLRSLAERDFIESKGSRWVYKRGEFHAEKNSPLVILHHQNWRQRASVDSQDFNSNGVHFTAVQTVSLKDYDRLKNLLLDFISKFSALAAPSTPEEGIALTCDLFKI